MMNMPGRTLLRALLTGMLIGLVLALAFAAGFLLRDGLATARSVSAQGAAADYGLLDEVQALLDAHFVRQQPDPSVREYGAIRGMLSTLNDPFTFFIEPPVAASESDVLAGTYGGVGVQVIRSEAGELLLFPYADSPAIAAGIQDGDALLAVNDTPVDLSTQADVLDQMLRGEVRDGSGANLTIRRAADGAEETVFVPFAVINVPSVTWRMLPDSDGIGYLQVQRFTSRTPEELDAAAAGLLDAGARAVVLDLRDNAGGLLQESIQVADAFLDSGVIVHQRDMTGERSVSAQPGGALTTLPLAVLINHGTASGAELVAGALHDLGRAQLIGQTTYGKGTVQQIFPLSDGSSLHVTASEWFTPAYDPLDGAGIAPDIALERDPAGRDIELAEAVRRLQAGGAAP